MIVELVLNLNSSVNIMERRVHGNVLSGVNCIGVTHLTWNEA